MCASKTSQNILIFLKSWDKIYWASHRKSNCILSIQVKLNFKQPMRKITSMNFIQKLCEQSSCCFHVKYQNVRCGNYLGCWYEISWYQQKTNYPSDRNRKVDYILCKIDSMPQGIYYFNIPTKSNIRILKIFIYGYVIELNKMHNIHHH